MQHASGSSSRPHEPGWPLLHLPAPAAAAVAELLTAKDSKHLRLVCKAAQGLVETHATRWRLRLAGTAEQPKGLPQRFPHVTHLLIEPPGRQDGGQHVAAAPWDQPQWPQGFSISRWETWPAVTQLTLPHLPTGCTAALLAGLPNFSHCTLTRPKYRSIFHTPEELQLLAACSKLVSFAPALEAEDTASLAALLDMTQLTKLDVDLWRRNWRVPITPDALSGLAALTALRQLDVHISEMHVRYDWSGAELKLPPSLSTLRLVGLPFPVNAVLPQLTTCFLDCVTVDQAALAVLATGQLVSLTAGKLCLTRACHTTPLLALRQLSVVSRFSSGAGTSLAELAPGLVDLSLRCDADVADGSALFAGLSALETLDGSQGDFRFDYEEQEHMIRAGLVLQEQTLQQLASLATLKQLRLNALPTHMECWHLFGAKLNWVFGHASVASAHLLVDALFIDVPEHVHSVFVEFPCEKEFIREGLTSIELWELDFEKWRMSAIPCA